MGSSIVKNAPPPWKMLIEETVGLEEGVYGSPLIFLFHFSVNLICFKKQSPLIEGKKKKDKCFHSPINHFFSFQIPWQTWKTLKTDTELRRSHKFEPFFH